ncbi:MAG: molybdopterin-binding protein [Alphaproteobacteria bacterium]
MKFGPVPLDQALDAISAHSVKIAERSIKKGARLTSDDLAALRANGRDSVIVAQLDADDMDEDHAAESLAASLCGSSIRLDRPSTGRVNLFASASGVLRVDASRIAALNATDESVTFATLPDYRAVERGEMVATVKIIPFAVSKNIMDQTQAVIKASPLVAVHPFKPRKVAAISTLLPGLKPSVINKTLAVLEGRLAPSSSIVDADLRVNHDVASVTKAIISSLDDGADLVIIYGASAITDRRDIIPSAIEHAGGRIEHFGMPVDPGNLLLIGSVRDKIVIGAPGCARSPKENGFDWVLHRVMADIPVTRADITALGVGGLLMEIVQRGHPRDPGAEHVE